MGGGEPGKDGIIKGDYRQILRNGDPKSGTHGLQGQGQDVIADHHCGGTVFPVQQFF